MIDDVRRDTFRRRGVAGASNGLRDVQAKHDVAEQVIRFSEFGCIVRCADEELRAIGISAGIRHRQAACRVVALHLFVFELVAWAAGASAGRIAALDDETGYDAMELIAIIELMLRQEYKVVDRDGRDLRVKLDDDQPSIGVDTRAVDAASIDGHSRSGAVGVLDGVELGRSRRGRGIRQLLRQFQTGRRSIRRYRCGRQNSDGWRCVRLGNGLCGGYWLLKRAKVIIVKDIASQGDHEYDQDRSTPGIAGKAAFRRYITGVAAAHRLLFVLDDRSLSSM